jgi:hypothetical protein
MDSRETSVRNYHSTLRNIPEESILYLHLGGSLIYFPCGGSTWYGGPRLAAFLASCGNSESSLVVL